MKSPDMEREISHKGVMFVDDRTDHFGGDGSNEDFEDDFEMCMANAQKGAQTWCDLTRINGGLVALHKTSWKAIAWRVMDGSMEMVKATEHTIVVKDGKGAYAKIDFLPPDRASKGLGYWISPSGNQDHHHRATLEAVQLLCDAAIGSYLTAAEAIQAVRQRIVPKLDYALKTTTFDTKQCGKFNTALRSAFVAPMGMNRHYPKAILHAPVDYGGMNFPEIESLQL